MGFGLRALENMGINETFWRGKKVLVTGHTGFKGSWLSLWLQMLEADVYGLSRLPPTEPNLFERADVGKRMTSLHGDIRDLSLVKKTVSAINPDILIHMAAQSLVRYGYHHPVETYQTNVMGTLHVLEAIRACQGVRAAVMVTTDKCYESMEAGEPHRENDPLGGHDPYSSSKGCAELLIASYRHSFFFESTSAAIASVRAGNVIGGGDWAEHRLVPDVIEAFQKNRSVKIRNPHAVRPWQHVLEPLSGYLLLAERLFNGGHAYAESWNFGPEAGDMRQVQWLVEFLAGKWRYANWAVEEKPNFHEAGALRLNSTKARDRLGWRPRWSLPTALDKTVDWYRAESAGVDMSVFCQKQIREYLA
ncbi:CDP-glucose 4,6-dehydratase [Methylomarinum sp. Ch1-1]|uniref:CDP-glucose 4,6-dehydratase n=1 Tax=Methylomarinum roseum TaxID=3067653 RepID=A0AAU7NUQ6_9GAMM